MTLKSRSNYSIEVPAHGWRRKSWLNFFSMPKSNNTLEPQIDRKAMIVDLEYPAADALLIANNKGVTEGGIIIKLLNNIWAKVFKNGPNKICGRQPLKIWSYMIFEADHITSIFLKGVFHKFYLVHSWILCPIFSLGFLKAYQYQYFLISLQQQPPEVFCKKNVLRTFAKFTGKHMYQGLFNKVAGLRLQLYLKRDSGTVVFLWILRNF